MLGANDSSSSGIYWENQVLVVWYPSHQDGDLVQERNAKSSNWVQTKLWQGIGHRAWMMWDGQLVLDILALVSTCIIWCYVWSDSFLSLVHLKISSAGQNAASSYLSIRFPPLAALVCCYIRPMSSLRLTFLYENHWIRRARFYSCQSFLTYYIMGAVGFVWPNLGFSPKCLDPSPMLGYPKDDVCFALMP